MRAFGVSGFIFVGCWHSIRWINGLLDRAVYLALIVIYFSEIIYVSR